MRHENGDLCLVVSYRPRDLQRRYNQPAGRVQHDVEGNVSTRHLDCTQDILGVIDVDVANDRETEKPHRLLPMHQ